MPVYGTREGLKNNNRLLNQVEPLINVAQLKNVYLFGIPIRDPYTKAPLPDESYAQFIDNAVSQVEHEIDIRVMPYTLSDDCNNAEYKDYSINNYTDWGYFQLNNLPIIQIDKIEMLYSKAFGDPNIDNPVQEIPLEWVRLEAHSGIIRLIPNNRFPSKLQIGTTGAFFPEVLKQPNAPHIWKFSYVAGFDDGRVPVLVNHAIGLTAAIEAFTMATNLFSNKPNVAMNTLSIDGLSQSIQYNQQGLLQTVKQMQLALYGDPKNPRMRGILATLKDYYSGEEMAVI